MLGKNQDPRKLNNESDDVGTGYQTSGEIKSGGPITKDEPSQGSLVNKRGSDFNSPKDSRTAEIGVYGGRLRDLFKSRVQGVLARAKRIFKGFVKSVFKVFVGIFGNPRFIRTMLFISFLSLLIIGLDQSLTTGIQYRHIVINPTHLYFLNVKTRETVDYEFARELIGDYNSQQGLPVDERTFADVVILELKGAITDSCGVAPPQDVMGMSVICAPWIEDFLNWVYVQDALDIKGVFIILTSPGGEVTASDRLFVAIKRLSQKMPVYVYVPDFIASGGVYIASAADKILVSPSAIVGNIGVIAEFIDYTELLNKIGVKRITFTSSKAKYKTLQGLLDEDRDDPEDKYLQAALDAAEKRFHKRLIEGRGELDIDKVASGLIFPAETAVELNLADKIVSDQDEAFEIFVTDILKRGDTGKKSYILVSSVEVEPKVSFLSPIWGVVSTLGQLFKADAIPVNTYSPTLWLR